MVAHKSRSTGFSLMQSTWWLSSLGNFLVWARLDVRPAGTAQVLDCDGNTLNYESEDNARAALLDAEFQAFDGIDESDAERMGRSEEHTSALQSLMRISYAVFCLKTKKIHKLNK